MRELRESPRQPGRYRVTLSDGRNLTLDARALSDAGATYVGAALEADTVATLVRESALIALTDRALGYLARGRRSRRELEIRLRRLEPDAMLVAGALDRLEANGVIDDEAVARAEAGARLRRGEGPGRVRQTLRRKGVADRTVTDALADSVESESFDERVACRTAAEKRARALSRLEPAVANRRLTAFLMRRGFAPAIIRDLVREVRGAMRSDEDH